MLASKQLFQLSHGKLQSTALTEFKQPKPPGSEAFRALFKTDQSKNDPGKDEAEDTAAVNLKVRSLHIF